MTIRVIQSHRAPLPASWYERCVRSVRDWCDRRGYEHCWLGDELFDPLPAPLRRRYRRQPVVLSDLARLHALEAALATGADGAVWIDADVLITRPELMVPEVPFALGCERWVQDTARGGLRVYRKVHNAFMCFRPGNSMLAFYRDAALRLLELHSGPAVPQLAGPKFLALLDNVLRFPTVEAAGALSPPVIRDLLNGGGTALATMLEQTPEPLAAVNLCGSMVGDALSDAQMAAVVEVLLEDPQLLAPP